ncbi:hypothetical protein VXR60_01540 [Acinetobacter baumannii]|uniref:hypothetical protein n=1 Tax=Acinetobacter baumannii TaxID=470 RepID=UPI0019027043|nr:hypothetical protein [Acinetobacter baumannii]MBJ9476541.1 hypothetical protein [Acinetobacter baumannii]
MATQAYVIVIEIPEKKCPNVRGKASLIKDGKAKVYLSNNTTSRDAENGFDRYGVTGGRNAVVVTEATFPKYEEEITNYLNRRFGEDWSLKLEKCSFA